MMRQRLRSGQHRVLEGESHLPFPGVGLAQPLVDALQLAGPRIQLRFHLQAPVVDAGVTGHDEVGDLGETVHDQGDASVGVQDGALMGLQ